MKIKLKEGDFEEEEEKKDEKNTEIEEEVYNVDGEEQSEKEVTKITEWQTSAENINGKCRMGNRRILPIRMKSGEVQMGNHKMKWRQRESW